uniref:Secreted protein n=1 Tax=Panstrongylus lignarius TaxID=156445 RepID=A0A224Y0Z4_9HEMI
MMSVYNGHGGWSSSLILLVTANLAKGTCGRFRSTTGCTSSHTASRFFRHCRTTSTGRTAACAHKWRTFTLIRNFITIFDNFHFIIILIHGTALIKYMHVRFLDFFMMVQ